MSDHPLTPREGVTLIDQLTALRNQWRDAAAWEYDDMGNTQSAQTFDQCADALDAILAATVIRTEDRG